MTHIFSWFQICFIPHIFLGSQNIFGPQIYFYPNFFEPEKKFGLKNYLDYRIFFWTKIFFDQNSFYPSSEPNFFYPNFFELKYLDTPKYFSMKFSLLKKFVSSLKKVSFPWFWPPKHFDQKTFFWIQKFWTLNYLLNVWNFPI